MKPTFLCSECQHSLTWGDQYCGNCGQPIEWPTGSPESKASPPRRQKEERRQRPSAPVASWKVMIGFAAFLVGGVVLLELLTGPRNVPSAPAPTQPAGTSANMEAMNRLTELEQRANANGDDLKARLEVANFAHDNRFLDKAIEHYKLYLEKKPNDPDALVDLGICFNDLGNLEQARTSMEKALKVSPNHLLAHFNLGIVTLRSGDMKSAGEWFKKTVALSPGSEVGKKAQQLLNEHLNAGQ